MTVSLAQAQIFLLALTRILIILAQIPVLGGSAIPTQYRISLGVFLALIALPWQTPLSPEAPVMPIFTFGAGILRELIIGFLAGYVATMTFGAFQTLGKVLELSSGFSAGQIFNPTLGDSGSAYDQFLVMLTLLFFFAVNGHHAFLIGLVNTFKIVPINGAIPPVTPDELLNLFSYFLVAALQMALPIMGALLLTDLTLGLLSKVAPQINVFFLGLSIKVWVAILGLMLCLGIILPMMERMFLDIGVRMLKLLGG